MTTVHTIRVDELHANPGNPRSDVGDVTDLAESIAERGVLQPLLAMPRRAGGYVLLAGHRRLAAAKQAKVTTVPVLVVRPQLPDDQLTIALSENLHRAPLSPMDEARACQVLLDMGRSRADIAVELSRSGSWVADRLALLALPAEVQRQVDVGELAIGKAAQLGHQVRKTGRGEVVVGARSPWHFTKLHPLAGQARARCDTAGHAVPGRVGPACGECWEAVIRDDAAGRLIDFGETA